MTNLEGRVLLAARPSLRRSGVRSDLEILAGARRAAGRRRGLLRPTRARSSTSCAGPAPAASPTTRASPTSGSPPRPGVFWPCPAEDHPGTPRPFLDRFATPDGRARFTPVEHRPPAEDIDARLPAVPDHRAGARPLPERRADPADRALNAAAPRSFVELHPDLAERLGVAHGRAAARGQPPRRAPRAWPGSAGAIRPDTVFMPFHWPAAANLLTNPALDPCRGCRSSRSARSELETAPDDARLRGGGQRHGRRPPGARGARQGQRA